MLIHRKGSRNNFYQVVSFFFECEVRIIKLLNIGSQYLLREFHVAWAGSGLDYWNYGGARKELVFMKLYSS